MLNIEHCVISSSSMVLIQLLSLFCTSPAVCGLPNNNMHPNPHLFELAGIKKKKKKRLKQTNVKLVSRVASSKSLSRHRVSGELPPGLT